MTPVSQDEEHRKGKGVNMSVQKIEHMTTWLTSLMIIET